MSITRSRLKLIAKVYDVEEINETIDRFTTREHHRIMIAGRWAVEDRAAHKLTVKEEEEIKKVQ